MSTKVPEAKSHLETLTNTAADWNEIGIKFKGHVTGNFHQPRSGILTVLVVKSEDAMGKEIERKFMVREGDWRQP